MQTGKFLAAAAFIIIAAGCNNVNFKKTKGGMPYKLFSSGKGPTLQPGDFIKVHFIQKKNDSVLVSTYETGPRYMPVPPSSYPYDISEVFPLLRKGDSVYAVQLVDTFLKKPEKVPPMFKKGDKIITTVKILDVFKTQEAVEADELKQRDEQFKNDKKLQGQLQKDIQLLNEYLTKNNIKGERTPGGVVVQTLTPGTGPKITDGKYVTVMYKGMTLAGKIFDTNMDTSFKHTEPLGFFTGRGKMMRGFEEGILMLRKGEKARIYIPSALAYGENPRPGSGIEKNESLIFDVHVLDVADKAPEMAMPPGMPDQH